MPAVMQIVGSLFAHPPKALLCAISEVFAKIMRLTAYKVKIEDLVKGQFVRGNMPKEPSYLITPWGRRVSRARILGTIVEKFVREDQSYCTLRIDDGSGTITVRAWREGVPDIINYQVGEIVDIIGRVREYAGEVYLVPEIISRIRDPNWEIVRELEILKDRKKAFAEGLRPKKILAPEIKKPDLEVPSVGGVESKVKEPEVEEIEEVEEFPLPEVPDEIKKKVLMTLDKLDRGDGVMLVELAAELDMPQPQIEDAVRVLIAEGEVFEPKVSKFKRLR